MTFILYFLSVLVFLNVSVKGSNLPYEADPATTAFGNTLTNAASKQGNQMLAATNPIRIGGSSSAENPVVVTSSRPPSTQQNQIYSSSSGEAPHYQQLPYNLQYTQPSPNEYYQPQQPTYYGQQYTGGIPSSYPSTQGLLSYFPSFQIPSFQMPSFEMPSFEMPSFEMPSFGFPSFSNYFSPNLERLTQNPFNNMVVDQQTKFDDGKFKAEATLYKTDPNNPNVKGGGISTSTSYSNSMKTNPDGTVSEMTPQEIEQLQQRIQSRMSSMPSMPSFPTRFGFSF